MVIIYKDSSAYIPLKSEQLLGFYSSKFEFLLSRENISYRIIDYRHPPFGVSDNFEDYDDWKGDYFVARFGHELSDKEYHSKNYDVIYDYYGENMWPNKQTYYYYDDKVRQYELLKKYNRHIPSVICNNLDELLNDVSVGTVVKSTYGGGGSSCFYIWEKEHLDNIEEYISNSYNSENFFPCIIQEYIDFDWEYIIFSTGDEIYGYKKNVLKRYSSPNSFPYNFPNEGAWDQFEYLRPVAEAERLSVGRIYGKRYDPEHIVLDEKELNPDLIQFILNIKNELNTPNLKFDMINGKVFEFSYLYSDTMSMIPKANNLYTVYNSEFNSFEEKDKGKLSHWKRVQAKTVLKHLGIIK